jgi:AraC-like DNA-binding protein
MSQANQWEPRRRGRPRTRGNRASLRICAEIRSEVAALYPLTFSDAAPAIQPIAEQRVIDLLVDLEELYSRPGLSLRWLGRRRGISPAHLGAMFRSTVGCPFRQYLRRLRIREAVAQLAISGSSLSEVAYAVGYSTLSSFDRDFASLLHMSPTAYRLSLPRS